MSNILPATPGASTTPGASATVEIPQPFKLDTVTVSQPKYSSNKQFIVDLAVKLYQAQLSDNTNTAKTNASKSMRNAMIFWNLIGDDYRKSVIIDGGDTSKVKIK